MNEICFVWGPPLSGQWRWMARAADEAEAGAHTTLIPLENLNSTEELEVQLKRAEEKRSKGPFDRPHHIYCELPWSVTLDDFALENWITQQRDLFSLEPSDPKAWNLSFLALCPMDAEKLPLHYRRGLEEFSRASQSSVIVLSKEGNEAIPGWLGTEVLDFGSRIEVFEEPLWPARGLKSVPLHDFAEAEEFEFLTLPLHGEREFYQNLFEEIAEGQHGTIWGAEASWKNERGDFEALSYAQGNVYSWTSDHPSLIEACSANGASLNLSGHPLRKSQLLSALKSQNFC